MTAFTNEIDTNFNRFESGWKTDLENSFTNLNSENSKYVTSYRRLVSIQAWRSELLENLLDQNSLSFYLEAQNDAVTSHVMSRLGAWRSALNSLRSFNENVLMCLFYKDHPVEFELWKKGNYRISFVELIEYLNKHPDLSKLPKSLTCLDSIRKEYSTLSKSVHASSISFRMRTGSEGTKLWVPDSTKAGAWSTRERVSIANINCLLVSMFGSHLKGTPRIGLRKAIALSISASKKKLIKAKLKIHVHSAP